MARPLRAGLARLARAVTLRGRAFVAVGVTCLVAAQVLGEKDLLRVGTLLIALPLAALLIVARTRYRMRLVRSLTPARVEAGATTRVLLRLENVARLPTAVLLMEDTVPYHLGGRPRFVLRHVEPTGVREATYTVRPEVRGRYELGPLTVRVTDPFGCVELARGFTAVDRLVVLPRLERLPPVRLASVGLLGTDGNAPRAATSGDADIATRDYRQGDDLRKIHWRSTAKRGALMVRRDEQPRQNRATVLLDTRVTAHVGTDGGTPESSSFEWAVSAAGSVAVWLAERGYVLRLVTTSGLGVTSTSPSSAQREILDLLAVIGPDQESGFGAARRALATPGWARGKADTGLVVAVIGMSAEHAHATDHGLDGLPPADPGIAVVLDTATWAAPPRAEQREGHLPHPAGPGHRALAAAGWQVLPARCGDELAALWPSAAAGARMGAVS